jgi:TolB-like protein
MENQLPRKLAAIMYADVVGYARLVGENEEAAHRRLAASLELMEDRVRAHRGQIVHYAGDALLAKFSAVTDSVNCALEVQKLLVERNADLPARQRMLFRIGLNLGDVIEDRGDIYGDGVNLAARLESRAMPGGICISDAVYQQVKGRSDLEFENLGELDLKNIAGKIHAYRIVPAAMPQALLTYEALTGESLDLPSRASIAVLPFLNISGDIEQEHFADGMAEDIITVLSRVPDLVVIARNSTFVYKGCAVDVRQVGRELEVAYVLEGSIQKRGDRLRITAQLARAQSGEHLWVERYDCSLDDIFAIQDDITREIVTALQIELTHGEEVRMRAERATSFEAWELLQRAYTQHLKFTREGNDEARRLVERVLSLDPNYHMARVLLAWVLQSAARFGYASDPEAAVERAESLARGVIEEDEQNGDAHAILCFILAYRHHAEEGLQHGKRATELGPSSAASHAALATAQFFLGDYQQSLLRMKKALRLSPYAPDWILAGLGDVYQRLGQLEKARAVFELLLERMPRSPVSLVRLAAICSQLGDTESAREAAENLLAISPEFSVDQYVQGIPSPRPGDREQVARLLREAGLPN